MTDSKTSDPMQLSDVFRSNMLPMFVQRIRSITAIDQTLPGIESFSMVLDANKIIAEIR
jgi:hypothetical protein